MERPVIAVELLRRVAEILLRHLEDVSGPEISFDKDLYWSIAPEQRFNPYSEPSEFTIGQLSECIEELTRLARNPEKAVSYGLVWLGEVIKAIGEETIQ